MELVKDAVAQAEDDEMSKMMGFSGFASSKT